MSTTIEAAQHIYGNVEEEHSPRRIGGFQTLFYTKERLTIEEVEEIETRMAYFPSESNPAKYLFFPLSSEKCVISRIIPLPGLDKYGRQGDYLAHNLILTRQDLTKIRYNPFMIIEIMEERELFIENMAMLPGDISGDISPLSFEIYMWELDTMERDCLEEALQWPLEELARLFHYTLNNRKLSKQKQALVETFERTYLLGMLERHDGNISRAAEMAGIQRQYLHRLMKEVEINAETFKGNNR